MRKMLEGYFNKLDEEIWAPFKNKTELIGGKIALHGSKFPKTDKIKLAIIGNGYPANEFRKAFYNLSWRFDGLPVADLGDLVDTRNEKEKHFALSEALAELQEQGIIAMVIGGEPGNIYAQYKSFKNSKEQVEIVQVCPGIDLEEGSPMRQILVEKPSNLFNIDFIATQAYHISQKTSTLLDKMYFENHRLGELRADIGETEPLLRSAHILMFDMNSVRVSDAPGTRLASPNGLYAEEAAAIGRYAGISNKLSSALFYGLELSLNRSSHFQKLRRSRRCDLLYGDRDCPCAFLSVRRAGRSDLMPL